MNRIVLDAESRAKLAGGAEFVDERGYVVGAGAGERLAGPAAGGSLPRSRERERPDHGDQPGSDDITAEA